MTDEEVERLSDSFVRRITEPADTGPRPPLSREQFDVGFIVAHTGFSSAISVPASGLVRSGIRVSVGAIVGHGLGALPTAQVIERAFAKLGGRPVRFIKLEDAAVLDWCWRNCSHDNIKQDVVPANASAIQSVYDLEPGFDSERVICSLDALERIGSIVSKPTGHWRLIEDVRVFKGWPPTLAST